MFYPFSLLVNRACGFSSFFSLRLSFRSEKHIQAEETRNCGCLSKIHVLSSPFIFRGVSQTLESSIYYFSTFLNFLLYPLKRKPKQKGAFRFMRCRINRFESNSAQEQNVFLPTPSIRIRLLLLSTSFESATHEKYAEE